MGSLVELKETLTGLEAVETELSRRVREFGIRYFVPNRFQYESMRSSAREVVSVSGNRSGKTMGGASELVCHLLGFYPSCSCHGEWFSKRRRFAPPIKAVVVSTEFPIIERAIEPAIMRYLPKDAIEGNPRRTPQGHLSKIRLKNGSQVDILTNEMDQMAFESAKWHFAWIDEPMSKSKYLAIKRGLVDEHGLSRLTFTPLIEPWMKEHIVDAEDKKNIEVIRSTMFENTQDIHGNPILAKEDIQQFANDVRRVDSDLERTRLYGEFYHMRGIVYKEFSPFIHEKDFVYQYPDPVIAVLDPHDRLPHHVIWAFIDRLDWVYVDRELVMEGTVKELSRQILLTEARAGYKMRKRLIDPNFGRKPLITTGKTVIQELATPPFPTRFYEANDDKQSGIMKVKEYLHYDPARQLGLTNSPKLFFSKDRCPNTIRSLKNYQYEEWKGAGKDEKDAKEKDKQKDTHGSDCTRYLLMSNPKFVSSQHEVMNMELAEVPY